MIYCVSSLLQDDLVSSLCFGGCGKIIVGAIEIPDCGFWWPCREAACPHEDKHSDVIGSVDGDDVCIRKLKENP